jgi:hypothetical protein
VVRPAGCQLDHVVGHEHGLPDAKLIVPFVRCTSPEPLGQLTGGPTQVCTPVSATAVVLPVISLVA